MEETEESQCVKCQNKDRAEVHRIEECQHSLCQTCLIHNWKHEQTRSICPVEDCAVRIPNLLILDILLLSASESNDHSSTPTRRTQSLDLGTDSESFPPLPLCHSCNLPVFVGRSGTLIQPCHHIICFNCQSESFTLAQLLKKPARCPAYCFRRIQKKSLEETKRLGHVRSTLVNSALGLRQEEKRKRKGKPMEIKEEKPLEFHVSFYQKEESKMKLLCPRGAKLKWLIGKLEESFQPSLGEEWDLYIRRELRDIESLDGDDEEVEVEHQKVDLSHPDILVTRSPISDKDTLILDPGGQIGEKTLW